MYIQWILYHFYSVRSFYEYPLFSYTIRIRLTSGDESNRRYHMDIWVPFGQGTILLILKVHYIITSIMFFFIITLFCDLDHIYADSCEILIFSIINLFSDDFSFKFCICLHIIHYCNTESLHIFWLANMNYYYCICNISHISYMTFLVFQEENTICETTNL